MKHTVRIAGAGALAVAALGLLGCHDGHSNAGSAPMPPATVSFPTYTQRLIENSTCETVDPAQINETSFQFSDSQDTADAFDTSSIAPGCS